MKARHRLLGDGEMNVFHKPPTTHEAVLEEMRRLIVTGTLRAGERVGQEALASHLGVSRVPIREALKTLESEGHVTYLPRRGYFVAELSLDEVQELHRLRELLEEEALRVALPRLGDEDREQLLDIEHAMEAAFETGDMVAVSAASRKFHFALFEPCGMPRLMRLIRVLWDATEPYRSVYYNVVKPTEILARNRSILEALDRGDTEAVINALAKHRRDSIEALKTVLTPSDQEGDTSAIAD